MLPTQRDGGRPAEPSLEQPAPRIAPGLRSELYLVTFSTGAAVILIEIIGTRVIGPVFGVSLFVWSALLAVTLGSLALGYSLGGLAVDRAPTPKLLGSVVVAAGLLLAAVPVLTHGVLRIAERLGPREGPLFAATLLFAPSLVALGMVGPVAVRLGTIEIRAAGRRVGSIYAVSTVGSLVGTFGTAFLLVPSFETDRILSMAALLLTLVGAVSLARHWRAAALAVLVAPLVASQVRPAFALPTGIRIRESSQSLYGLVEVIEDDNRQVRFLRSDHSVLGAQFLLDGSSAFAFVHLLESVRFLRPAARDVLQIGLGTGALPSALQRLGVGFVFDVVELDPAVVRFAREYFGFKTDGSVYEEDARTFVQRTSKRYDIVIHDTFTGGTTPEHLLSIEVVRRIHELLRPGGVLVLNFVGRIEGSGAEASRAVARTLRAVFPKVRAFRESSSRGPGAATNLIFFASDGPIAFTIPDDAAFENPADQRAARSFQRFEVFQTVPDGPVITDEHNPLAREQLPIAEEHFEAMNKLLPVEVWLH
jgi:SAM-dependent methyltransferase